MPRAFDNCVKTVTRRGGVKNAYAVCRASLGTDAQINARAKKKQRGNA